MYIFFRLDRVFFFKDTAGSKWLIIKIILKKKIAIEKIIFRPLDFIGSCTTNNQFSGRERRNIYHIFAFRDFKNILLHFFLYEIEDLSIINYFFKYSACSPGP